MSMARFRLRSLMILVALAAVGLGAATTAWRYRTVPATLWRYWNTRSMLQGEPSPALLLPYSVGLVLAALAAVVALSLVAIGIIFLALRLWVVLRASSPGPGRTRLDQ